MDCLICVDDPNIRYIAGAFGVPDENLYTSYFHNKDKILARGYTPVFISLEHSGAPITNYKVFKFVEKPCLVFFETPDNHHYYHIPSEHYLDEGSIVSIALFKVYEQLKHL